jgi:hypothetical protein
MGWMTTVEPWWLSLKTLTEISGPCISQVSPVIFLNL